MKWRMFLVSGLLMTLAACGGQQTLTYVMTIHETDTTKASDLISAAQRVMQRRLAAVGVKGGTISAVPTDPRTANLILTLPDAQAVEAANHILSDPFTFGLRIEKPSVSSGTGASEWIPTSLTGSSLNEVQVFGNKTTGEVSIELLFTPAGRAALSQVFSRNQGKHIGIFVRDLLVSSLTVTGGSNADHVVISGIPSSTVAKIFADDVNVGLKISFSPAP